MIDFFALSSAEYLYENQGLPKIVFSHFNTEICNKDVIECMHTCSFLLYIYLLHHIQFWKWSVDFHLVIRI